MPIKPEDLKTLVEWLGEEGAQAGLERSHLTVNDLRELLEAQGKAAGPRVKRSDLVAELLFNASRRIKKSKDELLGMSAEELLAYFDDVKPSRRELMALLEELDFRSGSEAQRNLYRYAARQISETGLFQRVAQSSDR